jgi:sialic acid synthase SpsE
MSAAHSKDDLDFAIEKIDEVKTGAGNIAWQKLIIVDHIRNSVTDDMTPPNRTTWSRTVLFSMLRDTNVQMSADFTRGNIFRKGIVCEDKNAIIDCCATGVRSYGGTPGWRSR